MGLVCMSCGYENGEAPEEVVINSAQFQSISVLIFSLIISMDLWMVKFRKIRPFFTPEMSMKELRGIMKKLNLQLYYDSLPAIFSYLKTGKCYQISSQQTSKLVYDYCLFVKTFKNIIKGK